MRTYINNEPHVAKHDTATAEKSNRTLLPVWCISSTVEDNTPESPHGHGTNIHAVKRNTSQSIITSSLQDNVRPTKNERVHHVSRASKVECKHCCAHRQVLDEKHGSHNDLKDNTGDGHWCSLSGSIHVPCGNHVCQDADCLDTERISVDLNLGELVIVVLQPEEEAVLEREPFGTGADGRPEKENPASA
jgi:hypothetical protein